MTSPKTFAMAQTVAIVGAGISGLTSAVVLAEDGYRTAIFAEEIGAGTTSGDSSPAFSSAGGTRVVFPAPGGATSTNDRDSRTRATISGIELSIGRPTTDEPR